MYIITILNSLFGQGQGGQGRKGRQDCQDLKLTHSLAKGRYIVAGAAGIHIYDSKLCVWKL